MMGVNTIIICLIGMMGLLVLAAWLFDQWRNKEDDDWEPYG